MTLDMPTPESLEAEANDLEVRADKKLRLSALLGGKWSMEQDAAIFREEAAAKRAKAQRLIMKDIEAGVRTPSGTLVSTVEKMDAQRQKHWEAYQRGEESDFS